MEEDSVNYRPVSLWETGDVISWMRGLHSNLEEHIPQFLAHCICGTDLLKMSHQQLDYLQVTQIGHQELLLEAVEMLAALEKGRSHDFTLYLASTLSKKTSQLIHAIDTPPSRKKQAEFGAELCNLQLREATSGVMMAAKHLLNWLDRNPCSLVQDYHSFRREVLRSALNLANMTQDDYEAQEMKDSCRSILKFTAVMMNPQNLSCMEPVKLQTVLLEPRDESGLGFSIQRTRQGNLVVNQVLPQSPAYESGVVAPGVEIVQINHQNVVGWEMSKVIATLKACGHQVSLTINTGNAKDLRDEGDNSSKGLEREEELGEGLTGGGRGLTRHGKEEGKEVSEKEEIRSVARCERSVEGAAQSMSQSQEESSEESPLSSARSNAGLGVSLSTNASYSDGRSSSQDTLDGLAESPQLLEGDTDFGGMENLLNKAPSARLPPASDLHRTSSAPLSSRELGGSGNVLEASTESGSTTGTHDEELLSLGSRVTTGSLEELDVQDGGRGAKSFESRLNARAGSDTAVGSGKVSSSKSKKSQSRLPPVAYRTQVIGGVVVRVPIKPEDQEKSNPKKPRHRRQRSLHKKNQTSGVNFVRAVEEPGSGDAVAGGVAEVQAPIENGPADADGSHGSPEKENEKVKSVFSDLKEVTIGGQTTKQVTVSSSTEIVGGSKKSSNPALMVPCFQLKDANREGFMFKLGGSGFTPKNWRRRWFVLKDRQLYYYKTSFDIAALGIVNMAGYTLEQSPESKKKHAFKASREGTRTYYFYTDTQEEMMSWMEYLSKSAEGERDMTDGPATIEASDDEL